MVEPTGINKILKSKQVCAEKEGNSGTPVVPPFSNEDKLIINYSGK